MIKNTLLLALTIILSTACANIAGNEIAPTYNLKSNTRGLFIDPITSDSLEQVNMLLDKQWYFTEVLTFDGKPDMDVNSCKTLSKATNENYKSTSYQTKSILKTFKKTCSTWHDMGQLKPSKESFLSSFKHSLALPKQMPPELALIISNDDERRLAKASSWEEMSHIKKVEPVTDDQAMYYDNSGGIQRLTIMAKGDYNQDGIEDIILRMSNSVKGGSYSSSYSYIVTRLAADAPYTLIKQF